MKPLLWVVLLVEAVLIVLALGAVFTPHGADVGMTCGVAFVGALVFLLLAARTSRRDREVRDDARFRSWYQDANR